MRVVVAAAMICLAAAGQTSPAGWLTLVNDLDQAVRDAPVAFPLGMLAPAPEYGATLVLRDGDEVVPCQVDDLNGDLRPDEVFCLTDLPANGRQRLTAEWQTRPRPRVEPRAAALVSYRPMTRAALESELLGWYLSRPLTLDVIGKLLVPKLTSDWFFGDSPHSPQSFAPGRGQGFLNVGDSFGAGGLALCEDPAQPAQLTRPQSGPGGAEQLHDVLADGPLRAVIRTRIWNWQGSKGSYAATVLHLVVAGQRVCETRLRFDQHPPDSAGIQIVAGFQQLDAEESFEAGPDWLAASGSISSDSSTSVGLGLVVPEGWSGEPRLVPSPDAGHAVAIGLVDGPPVKVYHLAAWDRDSGFRSAWDWRSTVADVAAARHHPVGVIVER